MNQEIVNRYSIIRFKTLSTRLPLVVPNLCKAELSCIIHEMIILTLILEPKGKQEIPK